jgi:hypothetical protein
VGAVRLSVAIDAATGAAAALHGGAQLRDSGTLGHRRRRARSSCALLRRPAFVYTRAHGSGERLPVLRRSSGLLGRRGRRLASALHRRLRRVLSTDRDPGRPDRRWRVRAARSPRRRLTRALRRRAARSRIMSRPTRLAPRRARWPPSAQSVGPQGWSTTEIGAVLAVLLPAATAPMRQRGLTGEPASALHSPREPVYASSQIRGASWMNGWFEPGSWPALRCRSPLSRLRS